ncbi:sporulation-delaying protein SdpB family protein [Archangium gephyra]|uniref:sporulation-delaying protein SdpB family protein n=1 Tax=Archangium gephyra TaxID=48 RepID=UPI003B7F7FDF
MLGALGKAMGQRLPRSLPWTNVYGLARTLLALGSALTLAFNPTMDLFLPQPTLGAPEGVQCTVPFSRFGLYCLGGTGLLELKRCVALVILLIAASGYRPRYLGILHWWVTFSFQANATLIEGGDQLSAILTFLLIPVTLTDGRKWHWSSPADVKARAGEPGPSRRFIAWWCFALIRLQVAGVYFHAALGKCEVPQWVDGTALYYWLLHPLFGAPEWLVPFVRSIVLNRVLVALLGWGVIALEFALAAGLLAKTKYRKLLLAGGVLLHLGIILVHGLVSFGLVMFAALLLYLWPVSEPLRIPGVLRRSRSPRTAPGVTSGAGVLYTAKERPGC